MTEENLNKAKSAKKSFEDDDVLTLLDASPFKLQLNFEAPSALRPGVVA